MTNSARTRTAARCLTASFALVLSVLLAWGLCPYPALADEASDAQQAVDQAQSTLDAAEARMADITSQYEALSRDIADLQTRIDDAASQALDAQQAVLDGRAELSTTARNEYRGGQTESLLTLVLGSQTFDELLQNLVYVEAVMRYQANAISEQQERSERLEGITADLDKQKDEQERALEELDRTRTEAESLVAGAQAQLQDAKDDQAARLAALKERAESLKAPAAGGTAQGAPSENANTTDREEAVPDGTPVTPNPDPDPPASSGNGGGTGGSSDEGSGWQSGVASAYGGATDPYTPNPGTTATGETVDDSSMGVAIPMAWPNYWSYMGRTVQISYGGTTVYATVNDCGGLGGGSRALDLQPGVWKAFGFSSCSDWGVRSVSYRFL